MSYANFAGADCTKAKFNGVEMQFASFRGTKLIQAQMVLADLKHCVFDGADMSLVYLMESDIEFASMNDVKMFHTCLPNGEITSN